MRRLIALVGLVANALSLGCEPALSTPDDVRAELGTRLPGNVALVDVAAMKKPGKWRLGLEACSPRVRVHVALSSAAYQRAKSVGDVGGFIFKRAARAASVDVP